ncbi:hypothetical protein DW742_09285 [Butyricicoccus sp. AM28-25]|nr:hypothetical protein DW742_09285 [Butyricicoccus sp. AM28-25]
MLYQKQECNGPLYQMCLYSMGTMPGMSPRQRAGRRRTTDAAKQEINRCQRKWRLMQLICANFRSGHDLFICLTYAPEAARARALEKFHGRMKAAYKKLGLTYKYIAVTEEHDMDGEPVRLHHHLIISGAADMRLAETVRACWPYGHADVRTLREGADFFEDTALYLLKEDKHKARGARRYSTSRNLTPPAEPVRLRLPEEAEPETPPGVKIVENVRNANEFGRYEIMVGRIYDHKAFDAWYAGQRRKAAPDPWERLRRRKRKSYR